MVESSVSLSSLPAEVILEILRHLGHGDLNRMARVCRRLYALGTLPALWRDFNLKVRVPVLVLVLMLGVWQWCLEQDLVHGAGV